MKYRSAFLLCLLWLTPRLLSGTDSELPLKLSPVEFNADVSRIWSYKEVQQLPFVPYPDSLQLPLTRNEEVWFRFSISNQSPGEIAFLLETDLYKQTQGLFQFTVFETALPLGTQAGAWVPYRELSVPRNRYAVHLYIGGLTTTEYYLCVKSLRQNNLAPVHITLNTPDEATEARDQFRVQLYTDYLLVNGFFWGAVFFCLLLGGYQYYWYREKAYLYYILYISMLSLVYLRTLEGSFGHVLSTHAGHGAFLDKLEIPLQYFVFAAYTLFIYYFLDLQLHRSPLLDRLFKGTAIFFVVLAMLQLPMELFFPDGISRLIYNAIRLPFAAFFLVMISYILLKYHSPLNIYLIAGTLLLALPSIFTAVVNQLEGKLGYIANISLIRSFNFYESDLKLYMYHTRIGVILELICFVIALAYKNRWKIQQFQQSVKPDFPAPQEKVEDSLLTRIRQLILQHLDDDQYGIDELCQSLAISRAHLHNRIKKSMGLPTSHFIRNIRLEEGKNRLLTTNLNISEIAYAVGFSDPNYFTRIFTAYYGISPKRMREETEVRRRKTEDRSPKSEDRRRKKGVGRRETQGPDIDEGDRQEKTEDRRRETEDGRPKTADGRPKSEVRRPETEDGSRKMGDARS